ncbi:MAG: DUF4190 domain-containing protein [Acidobacteriota bacterium]
MSANFQPINPRKGLAIASLVLGIISIPTFGLFAVGGITGIILGAVALSKIKNNPQVYGGRGIAIAGIITSAVSLVLIFVLSILAAIALPKLQDNLKLGRETATINSLSRIHASQAQYSALNGKFGTLQELSQAGLIDAVYANGTAISGYVYSSSEADAGKYCVQATRQGGTAAYKDFNVIEDGTIRYIESKTPNPVPYNGGIPLQGAGAGTNR